MMKTLIFSIAMAFSLVASAQPQTALNCADDKKGIHSSKIKDVDTMPWNKSTKKDQGPYLNGVPFTGILKQCGKKSGKVRSKTTYKKGLKDGLSYKYHEDGWLLWKKHYANGKEDYIQEYFHKPLIFTNDNKTASVMAQLQTRLSYEARDGKREGTLVCWYADGKKKHVEQYVNGVKHGEQLYYDESENLIGKENWERGKKHGVQYYYEDKYPVREENWENGVKHGLQTFWDKGYNTCIGCVLKVESWENGVQVAGYARVFDLWVWSYDLYGSWFEAKKKCADIGEGWRLPTLAELDVSFKNRKSINSSGIVYQMSGAYCSSQESSRLSTDCCVKKLVFEGQFNGDILEPPKNSPGPFRPVHSGDSKTPPEIY